MYMDFGNLGVEIKKLVDEYQQQTKGTQSIESLEDIKRFVELYPQFKKLSGNVSKHVTMMSEMSQIIEERAMLEVSAVEQELANNHNHSEHLQAIRKLMNNPKIQKKDLLRLVILYALRYETTSSNETRALTDELTQLGLEKEQLEIIPAMLKYAGANVRGSNIFNNSNFFKIGITTLKRGLKGVQNIYTEHKPWLQTILDLIFTNKLDKSEYPFVHGNAVKDPPQDVIIFFVGGITYEETRTVHTINARPQAQKVTLGGTRLHNSKSFLKDVLSIRELNYRG